VTGRSRPLAVAVALVVLGCFAAIAWAGRQPTTKRIDVDTRGRGHAQLISTAVFSANGRYVAWGSLDGAWLRDRRRRTLRLVSLSSTDKPVRDAASGVDVSADGRYVTFSTSSPRVVPGDTNETCFSEEEGIELECEPASDVFLRDRRRGTTERVSLTATGEQADRGESFDAAVSADGRYVAFTSSAPNLVPGDTNDAPDVFLRDRSGGTTVRISAAPGGDETGGGGSSLDAMTPDARYVLFSSGASNLVEGDSNGQGDVFLFDRTSGTTTLVSLGNRDQQGDKESAFGDISDDGRRVVFRSEATNLVSGDTNGTTDIYLRDVRAGRTARVSVRRRRNANDRRDTFNGESLKPVISADGRWAAFESFSSQLVARDRNDHLDVFVRDLDRRVTRLVSVSRRGRQGNSYSASPGLSAHGSFVAFESAATNLGGRPPKRNQTGLFTRGPLHR
jgi:Tol biopolymer transport system component